MPAPSCPYQAPYHANRLLPRLDHTPLAAVDWARGEHVAKAGPIRVLTPGAWRGWDRVIRLLVQDWTRYTATQEMLAARFSVREPGRSERYFFKEEMLLRQEMRNSQRAWFLLGQVVVEHLPWGALKQSPPFT